MHQLENLYRQIIMDHYKNPRNKGLKEDDSYVTARIKNPSCGDDVTIQTKVESGVVKDVRHEGSGCSICCSSASVLSVRMKNQTVEDALGLVDDYLKMIIDKNTAINEQLDDALAYQGVRDFPARVKCATIAWKAFAETLKKG